jgi:PAS domain S-box-containing protein
VTAPVGHCFTDTAHRYVSVNERLAAINGLPVAAHLGRSVREVLPELADFIVPLLERVIASGQPVENLDIHAEAPSEPGVVRDWLASYYPVRGAGGEVIGVSAVVQDVTAAKRGEAALKAQNQRLNLLSEAAERLILSEQPRELLEPIFGDLARLLDAQFYFNYTVGPEPDTLTLESSAGLTPEEREQFSRLRFGEFLCGTVAAEGRALVVEDVQQSGDPLTAGARARGIQAYAGFPLVAHGRLIGTLAVASTRRARFDADELKLIETVARQVAAATERSRLMAERGRLLHALEVEHATLEQVLQQMPAGVSIVDAPGGRRLYSNREAERLLGHPLHLDGGYTGYARYGAVHADGREYAAEEYPTVRSLLRGEVIRDEEMIYRRGDGALTTLSVNSTPVRDSAGRIVAAACVFTDITERKRAEAEREQLLARERAARAEAEAANRMKDEFLGVVSHELRTPLSSILGWSRILNTQQLDEAKRRHALDIIQRSARTQAHLVEDLLDASRIITGKLHVEMRSADLAQVARAALETVRPAAEAKSLKLTLADDGEEWCVLGDAARLQQVVVNLLSNAVKFTPPGGRVAVELKKAGGGGKDTPHSPPSDRRARLTVRDTGKGISAEFLPYVFERFRQADASSKRAAGGLGLGLAIVRHIVETHGGEVFAGSEGEGRGAQFTIELPLATGKAGEECGEEQRAAPNPEPRTPHPELAGARVLVVDDDADALEVMALILRQAGAEVVTAATAATALSALKSWRPDALLSDIGLPDHDGYDLIAQVRALTEREGGRTPAAALTAYARPEDRARTLAAGFQTHISKPVEPRELVTVVRALVSRR